MILIDSSVWIDHLRSGYRLLIEAPESDAVVIHPSVAGEIACASLTNRASILDLLKQLPMATVAESDEVLGFIEGHKLRGKGIGYIDVHLLASAAIGGAKLWTRDRRLDAVARKLGCALPVAGAH